MAQIVGATARLSWRAGTMDGVSTSWSTPDASVTVSGTAFGRSYQHTQPASPPRRDDLVAGLTAALVTVLAGAPVGLLWAALAPRVPVVVQGEDALLADVYGDGRIAADAYFLGAVLVAGIVTGALAFRLGRRHGPAVVTGLAAGGLAAAYVAQKVGERVGLDSLRTAVGQALRAGREGTFELNLALSAKQALAGWPVAALVTYLALTLLLDRGRGSHGADPR